MENIPVTDQWKLDGICTKCRRANYCGKDCSALRKRKNKIIEQAYRDVLKEKYPELNQIIDDIPNSTN